MPSWKEIAGQMFMVGIPGTELTPEAAGFFRDLPVGGVIFFAFNLNTPEQIYSLCRTLREQCAAGLPPFLAIDQEGGRVHRLPQPFTRLPSARELGSAASPELAYRFGRATARELRAVGINLNFAPVLDVLTNPENPIIGDRSLGSEPAAVGALGWKVAEGLRSAGVIPCGKHFPGHGDTAKDSHLELPVVAHDADRLAALELQPFVHACAEGIDSLMTAHALYPAFDRAYPATLSRAIVTGQLRNGLHYPGVIFTDDLEMGAITRTYSPADAAELAVTAGVDVLLFGHEWRAAAAAWERILERGRADASFRRAIEKSYARILSLKQRYLESFPARDECARLDLEEHRHLAAEIKAACTRYTR